MRVHLLQQRQLFGAALVELANAVEAGVDANTLLGLKAQLLAGQGEGDAALKALEIWAEREPKSYRPWLELARLEANMGRVDEALRHLGAAEVLAPSSIDAEVRHDPIFYLLGANSVLARRAGHFHGRGRPSTVAPAMSR